VFLSPDEQESKLAASTNKAGEKSKQDAQADEHAHDETSADNSHAGDAHPKESHAANDPAAYFLDPVHLFHHVQDDTGFEVPGFLGKRWEIPNLLGTSKEQPLIRINEKLAIQGRLTKFMVLELVGAILVAALFISLARRIRSGERAKGRFWNLLETFVVFVRDEIARPSIGKHDADRFMPFLLTLFFFILSLNLLGMLPWLGGATGALGVTGVLAFFVFVVVIGSGMKKMGVVPFLKAQVPHMDLPKPMALVLVPGIWMLEIFGLFVKHFVLAIRLFANIFAGHLVLAVFMAFIGATSASFLYYLVGPAALFGSIAFSLLELFVAFLQAYIFTFLTSLFIGAAVHPH
jgi:F-type H+-transporting ATPase subunit a